jgi:hypothetical protein
VAGCLQVWRQLQQRLVVGNGVGGTIGEALHHLPAGA